MLDLKGLEAAARKLRNAEKEKFGSWPDADDSKSIAAAAITAYLQAVGPEPAVADENKRLRAVISKVCEALPNGAFCSPNCTIEFMEEVPSEVASVISALVATPPAEQHPDDIAVDCFAAAMKAKLKWEREHRNRSGWQAMSAADLSRLLYEHLPKGDPVDVANLSMMLHQNGQQIETPPAEPVVEALRSEADNAYCRFLDKMSAPLCLGVEHKLETGKFGAAELNAHVDARELYGFHRGINHALAALATKSAVKDDETVVLPRLTDDIIRAACTAHFGTDNADGVCVTVRDRDWTFREAFKRMWSGARAALAAKDGRS